MNVGKLCVGSNPVLLVWVFFHRDTRGMFKVIEGKELKPSIVNFSTTLFFDHKILVYSISYKMGPAVG